MADGLATLLLIATAKQIGVIEKMIEVVDRDTI